MMDIMINEHEVISKIYQIRGQKVMLDKDLAALYGVTTGRLNEQVKRNIERFPADFMFRLTAKEADALISQFAISKKGGRRTPPYAFTEYGVLMLSSVLNNPTAIQVNIQIMRVYTKLREMLLTNQDIYLKLEQLDKKIVNMGFDVQTHDGEISSIFELIKGLMSAQEQSQLPRTPIGFKRKKNNLVKMFEVAICDLKQVRTKGLIPFKIQH